MSRKNEVRSKLIQSLNSQSREMSTRTVLFHHWISERLKLNTIDHKCLDIIVRAEAPINGVQLAKLTGLSSGAVTGVIDRLEKRGYVIRDRDIKDRRLVFIRPVEQKIEEDISPIFSAVQETFVKFYSSFTDDELRLILNYTTRCTQVMMTLTDRMMKTGMTSYKK